MIGGRGRRNLAVVSASFNTSDYNLTDWLLAQVFASSWLLFS